MLSLVSISKKYPSFSLKNVSFAIQNGDYFILLGVSGSGKSMVLESIAGLLTTDSGSILLNGKDITHEKIQKRKIGLVFQDHAIFPHLSVYENVAYPLKGQKNSSAEKKKIIDEVASRLGIAELLNRRPVTLSGGEMQRVALARALVQQPEVLLLDEPLASLDTRLKTELRSLLRQLNRQGQTIIHVTHDYEEALSLGNSIAVMHQGEILQIGTPAEVFAHPKSEFVAHFIGAKNYFRAVLKEGTDYALINEKIRFRINQVNSNGKGFILLRGEDIFLSVTRVETSAINNFEGIVKEIVPTNSGYEVLLDIGIPIYSVITAESLSQLGLEEEKECFVHFKASAIRFIPE